MNGYDEDGFLILTKEETRLQRDYSDRCPGPCGGPYLPHIGAFKCGQPLSDGCFASMEGWEPDEEQE